MQDKREISRYALGQNPFLLPLRPRTEGTTRLCAFA